MQMGTLVTITAVAQSESVAQAAATAGFAEIRRLEELLSTWIPTSELSRVNASAGVMPVHVSPETLTVVQACDSGCGDDRWRIQYRHWPGGGCLECD